MSVSAYNEFLYKPMKRQSETSFSSRVATNAMRFCLDNQKSVVYKHEYRPEGYNYPPFLKVVKCLRTCEWPLGQRQNKTSRYEINNNKLIIKRL